MILQIDKLLTKSNGKEIARTDIVENVKRVNKVDGFVMVEFYGGEVSTLALGIKDSSFTVDTSEEFKNYVVTSVYLLNNEGKTLNKLL